MPTMASNQDVSVLARLCRGLAFSCSKRVKNSAGAAWKWLNTENSRFEGRKPIDLTTDEAEARELKKYMADYAAEFNPN